MLNSWLILIPIGCALEVIGVLWILRKRQSPYERLREHRSHFKATWPVDWKRYHHN